MIFFLGFLSGLLVGFGSSLVALSRWFGSLLHLEGEWRSEGPRRTGRTKVEKGEIIGGKTKEERVVEFFGGSPAEDEVPESVGEPRNSTDPDDEDEEEGDEYEP